MSPGTTRIRKKMSTATPSSVGIIRRSRFTMYLPMRSVPPLAERLLGEPHGVELLVQEVAGRDRPATHPRAVRDDAVPLERVESLHAPVAPHRPAQREGAWLDDHAQPLPEPAARHRVALRVIFRRAAAHSAWANTS